MLCCDGLSRIPEAIEATRSQTTVQICVEHVTRAAMRFVSYSDPQAVAAALKPTCQAVDAKTTGQRWRSPGPSQLGTKYPSTVATIENHGPTPQNARRKADDHPTSAKPPANWSSARSPQMKTSTRPSAALVLAYPTASRPTYEHPTSRLHRNLDKLR